MNNRLLTIISYATLVGLLSVTSIGWYVASQEKTPETSTTKEKVNLTLPADINTSRVSTCRNNHGVHASSASNATTPEKPWAGPTYLFWPQTGQVAAIEYHFKESEIKKGDAGPTAINNLTFPLQGANYDHFTISYTMGHPSYEIPHYDVHVYTKTLAERQAFKCPEGGSPATGSAVKGAVDNYENSLNNNLGN